jgi:phosphoglycolate phosphatase-like HAD superfamily hydrolase
MSTVVSAKIPKSLKEKAARYGIEISQTVRDALEEKIRAIEEKELGKNMDELRSTLGHLKKSDIVKAVRTSRDER